MNLNTHKKSFLILCSSLLIGSCQHMALQDQQNPHNTNKTYQVTLLHTNDNHGRFWHNQHGEYGMAARKTVINQIRSEQQSNGAIVLVLSGGDINTGIPESDIQDAEPDFIGMEDIGYDAMAVGNHEFDNPLSVIKKQQGWVNFPFLSANIYVKSTGKRLFKPYKIFDQQGLKIAVLGLTTDDTVRIGNPEFIGDIEFRSPIEEAKSLVPELSKQADLIVAVTHMGHYQNGTNGTNAPGDVALARAVPGIHVIIGGHSQEPVCMDKENKNSYDNNFKPGKACIPDQQNGAWIVQAHEWGKYVGHADLSINADTVTLEQYSLVPVNLKVKKKDADGKTVKDANGNSVRLYVTQEITQDASLKALLKPYQTKGEQGLNIVVGTSDGVFVGERGEVRFKPTNLGFLIAQAQRTKVNADVSVMNSGGIRANLEGGDITYKAILTTQPFGNTICKLTVTGKELTEYLQVAASKPIDTGSFAQFAGVDISIENNTLISATINGQAIKADQHYTMALNSFLASGGDGYPDMSKHPSYINTGFVDADVLLEHIKTQSPMAIADYAPNNVKRR